MYQINVTESDKIEGTPRCGDRCAISRAAQRGFFNPDVYVDTARNIVIKGIRYTAVEPEIVQAWIDAYDQDQDVPPITFAVKIAKKADPE